MERCYTKFIDENSYLAEFVRELAVVSVCSKDAFAGFIDFLGF